ncbi:hypothetical protein vBVhaSVHB1_7 [Vibrio phage vB_VhaS-VHB1]|nr:hypothetical protein vBVhaSVHB1_7 [Vibrio phage vB_VhaS-VHB1]
MDLSMKKVITFDSDKPLTQTVTALPYLRNTSISVQAFHLNGDPLDAEALTVTAKAFNVGDLTGSGLAEQILNTANDKVKTLTAHINKLELTLDAAIADPVSKIEVTVYQSH